MEVEGGMRTSLLKCILNFFDYCHYNYNYSVVLLTLSSAS